MAWDTAQAKYPTVTPAVHRACAAFLWSLLARHYWAASDPVLSEWCIRRCQKEDAGKAFVAPLLIKIEIKRKALGESGKLPEGASLDTVPSQVASDFLRVANRKPYPTLGSVGCVLSPEALPKFEFLTLS